jgi:FlaG/FlaF family flagellin (archaellin)
LLYFDVTGGGSDEGYDYGATGAHDLPFEADFVYWAESDASNDLYAYGFLGWGVTSLSADNVDADFSGDFAEIMVPFSRLGGMPSSVRMIAVVQGDSSADVTEVYPDQAMDSSTTLQDFSEYYTVVLGANNLPTGVLSDEVLTYRTFLGSNVPSAAKEYDVMIKHTNDDCAVDWANEDGVNMSDNVVLDMNIKRACPTIGSALTNVTVNEDSAAYTVSLTSYASDEQDTAASLTWAVDEGETVVVYGDTLLPAEGLVTWSLTGHDLSITPVADQFGEVQFNFTVTDSNGLQDDRTIRFVVENINDAPEICQRDANNDCVDTVMLFGDAAHVNYIPEDSIVGGQSVSVILSDRANVGTNAVNLIKDQPNENAPSRQNYTWAVTVDETCPLFSVGMVDGTVLTVTGKSGMAFEAGGSCDITLSLSDDGAENQNAVDEVITMSVVPVNDAPTIDDWDLQAGDTITWASNDSSLIYGEWTIKVLEDTEDVNELTFDLAALKNDVDHDLSDLTWSLLPKLDDQGRAYCAYSNYFSFTFNDDELVLDLVKDATTNAPINQIDYLYDGGVHQVNPAGKGFCEMELYLTDSAAAPTGFAYDINDDGYIQQTSLKRDVKIIVQNVAEQVPDYYFEATPGFDFNGVSNVMDGTWVPVTVTVTAGGDEGPYNHDSMLMITFQSDGHSETERDALYIDAPAYGQSVTVDSEVFVKAVTTTVWVEMDVKTCVDESCDMTKSVDDRFIADEPASHGKVTLPNSLDYWAEPGFYGSEDGTDSIRRPVLEDKDWCNNVMYNTLTGNIDVCDQADYGRGSFEITDQELPDVVRTIGASGVPSFAPSIVAVALAGIVVGLLALAGRRDEEEEEEEQSSVRFVDDETAVSPVIATILMVAITVVLSGVIYVWASSLAETDVKGVPRITFDIEDIDAYNAETGHWKIEVQQSETELATQAVEIKVFAAEIDGVYEVKMANSDGVYGFSPYNSDSLVTFSDSVRTEGDDKVSTFFVGDTIFVRTHLDDGTPLTDVTIQLSYAPEVGQGALLRTWSGLSYDLAA